MAAEMKEKNSSIRQQRNPTATAAAGGTRGKRAWRWSTPQELISTTSSFEAANNSSSLAPQKEVFLNMQLRKSNRALTGTKSRNTMYEFSAVAIFLTIIFSTAAQDCYEEGGACTKSDDDDDDSAAFVSLTFGQVVGIGFYTFCAIVISTVFKESRFIELLYWMLIYLPLIFIMLASVVDKEERNYLRNDLLSVEAIMGIFFLVAECLAALIFIGIYFLYPKLVNSVWFRNHSRAAMMFWNVNVVADWTFSYTKRKSRLLLGRNHICKYQGDIDPGGGGGVGDGPSSRSTGLPHGIGQWFDDSAEGM
jgi:hypothetical protein